MALLPLDLPDADVALDPGWLVRAEAEALMAQLLRAVPWEVHHIRLFGRNLASPRLSCWIGDPGAAYRYSGTRHEPHPWPIALAPVRARLRSELEIDFNSVLVNRYRNGRDAMGWHADDEPELGARPVIASLSLGASRRFVLRHRGEPSRRLAIALPAGSLLVMRGQTQSRYRHALPRTARMVGERINLTFRRIVVA